MPSLTPDGRRLNGKGSKWIQPLRRLAIYLRDGFTCAYCGKDLHNVAPAARHLDHLEPKVNGANHASENLITACGKCNSRRQHRTVREFVELLVREQFASASNAADAEILFEISGGREEVTRRVRKIRNQARRSMVGPTASAREFIQARTSTRTEN